MKAPTVDIKSAEGRSEILFFLLLGSLYLPYSFSSLLIALFLINSFFTPGFWANLKSFQPQLTLFSLLFFAMFALSLFYTANLSEGFFKLQTKLSFLLMPVALAGSGIARDPGYRKKVLLAFILFTVLAAVSALLNAAHSTLQAGSFHKMIDDAGTPVKEYFFTYTNLAFFIMHPGYFSLLVGSAIFSILFVLVQKNPGSRYKPWLYSALGFLLVFLFLLQGRVSILAFFSLLFLGLIFYFFSTGSYLKGLMSVVAPVLLFLAILVLAPKDFTRRFTEFNSLSYQMDAPSVYDFNGITLRMAEWHCALDAIGEQPVLGYGIGDSRLKLLESYRANNFVVGLARKYNAHNQYLETMLQTGLVGLVLMLLIFIKLLAISFKNRDLLLFTLTSFLMISMLTESMLERQWAIGFFTSLVFFLAYSSGRGKSNTSVLN